MLDRQAALTLEAFEIKDLTVEGGEEVVFREVDDRFFDGWNGRGHGRGFRLENREERTD